VKQGAVAWGNTVALLSVTGPIARATRARETARSEAVDVGWDASSRAPGTLYSRGWPVGGGIADLPDLFESMQVAAESADENVR
jgi:hypothetical protein